MNQRALKEEVIAQAEPHISEALSAIKDTIKGNLEKGFDHFKGSQQEGTRQSKESEKKTADVFYLTNVLEADGSITTLKKQGKTGMSETETKTEEPMALDASTELPAVDPIDTLVVAPTEAPALPESFAVTPAADFEIGGSADDAASTSDLASKETMIESAAAFSELANVARQLSSAPPSSAAAPVTSATAGGYTVDALMREMLRPMLKEWLDAHLPSLVKWLVTEQIEKMLKDQLGVKPTPMSTPTPAPIPEAVAPVAPADIPVAAVPEAESADPTAGMDFDTPTA